MGCHLRYTIKPTDFIYIEIFDIAFSAVTFLFGLKIFKLFSEIGEIRKLIK